jgi:hypothetical protein
MISNLQITYKNFHVFTSFFFTSDQLCILLSPPISLDHVCRRNSLWVCGMEIHELLEILSHHWEDTFARDPLELHKLERCSETWDFFVTACWPHIFKSL